MPLREVGVWAALIIGLGGGGGALLAGVMVDVLGRRDRRWYAWTPGAASLLSVPFGCALFLSPASAPAIAFGFVTVFFANAFVAPVNALAQSLVSPFMRGFTAAVLLLVPTIFGVGLGPFLTGLASDLFAAGSASPGQALQYANLLALLASLAGGVLLMAMGPGLLSRLPPSPAPTPP
jgi:MFS family permease